jgi:hypothetical protein
MTTAREGRVFTPSILGGIKEERCTCVMTFTESETPAAQIRKPGADRGPRAGSPRGVVVATAFSSTRLICNGNGPGRYRSWFRIRRPTMPDFWLAWLACGVPVLILVLFRTFSEKRDAATHKNGARRPSSEVTKNA